MTEKPHQAAFEFRTRAATAALELGDELSMACGKVRLLASRRTEARGIGLGSLLSIPLIENE